MAPERTEAESSILLEAQGLVHGEREASYSHPWTDFSRTAGLANAIGFSRHGKPIEPEDVGIFQILVKLSRLAHRMKRDSLVDIAGYAETVNRVADRRAKGG